MHSRSHSRGCPRNPRQNGRMQMTIDTTSYPANPHKVLMRVIFDALFRCKRSGGMSRKSIQARIQKTYHCKLGVRFEKQLTKSLKRLVRGHHLEKHSHKYKITQKLPKNHSWKMVEALPLKCKCNKPLGKSPSRSQTPRHRSRSRSTQKCHRSRSSSSHKGDRNNAAIGSRERVLSRSQSRSRSRSRKKVRKKGRRRGRTPKRKERKGRRGGRGRHAKRRGTRRRQRRRPHSRSRSRARSRSSTRRSRSVTRHTSKTRGRSLTRRTRSTYTSRSSTRSTSQKRRRIYYSSKTTSRIRSRSSDVVNPPVSVPVPKLDAKRGVFEPGLTPAISTASTSHSTHRGRSPSRKSRSRSPSKRSARSPGKRLAHSPARSSTVRMPPPTRSIFPFPYLPVLKPTKPALRQSAPQSPSGTDTLTPKSMVKFLTE